MSTEKLKPEMLLAVRLSTIRTPMRRKSWTGIMAASALESTYCCYFGQLVHICYIDP